MAIGYSASSASIFPQIRYAGRLATDPLNTLAQAEATLFAGTGSQTGTGNRWGDYSAMSDRSGGRLHVLVHQRVLRDHQPVQLAHAHRLVQVPGLWWRSDADSNSDVQLRRQHQRRLQLRHRRQHRCRPRRVT